jgi:serine protease Do
MSLAALSVLLMIIGYFGISAITEIFEKPSLFAAPPNPGRITELAKSATLEIWCDAGIDDHSYAGSGWQLEIENKLYLITNGHVIEDCMDQGNIFVLDKTGQLHVSELLGYQYFSDPDTDFDVAVLTGRDIAPALKLAREEPKAGHWVMITGWPSLHSEGYQSVVIGSVTGVLRDRNIVSDAQSQKGMSGGPVINSRGEVIGIHYAATNELRSRTLTQPLSRLCQVAFVCDKSKRPVFPLKFPDEPMRKYIPEVEEEPIDEEK